MEIISNSFTGILKRNVALAPLTTIGVGGSADYFAEVDSADMAGSAIEWAQRNRAPLLILGEGSNVIVSDKGFRGLVLRIAIKGIEKIDSSNHVLVSAGGGVNWDRLVEYCVRENLSGLECLSGIPGTVGAAPVQNIGAYGQEMSEYFLELDALDIESRELCVFKKADCEFGYRTSRFKVQDKRRYIITRVRFIMATSKSPEVRYEELRAYLIERGKDAPSISDIRGAVLEIRCRKSMIVDPEDPDSRSAGSFFVNPVITRNTFNLLCARMQLAASKPGDVPAFELPDGNIKISAAWLIEHAGFSRGYSKGRAGISNKHSLALVNRGGATAEEILSLADEIIERVLSVFDLELTPEPVFAGFD